MPGFMAIVAAYLFFTASIAYAESIEGIDGTWLSRGYGKIWQIEDGHITQWDINELNCRFLEKRQPVATFLKNTQLSKDGSILRTNIISKLTLFSFDRVRRLPDRCSTKANSIIRDPLTNFQVLWQEFFENYAFFSERAVDWHKVREKILGKLSKHMSDEELFEVLSTALEPFHDIHVHLQSEDRYFNPGFTELLKNWDKEFETKKQGSSDSSEFMTAKIDEIFQLARDKNIDQGSWQSIGPNIRIATLRQGDIAYIQILNESGFAPVNSSQVQADEAGRIFREIFNSFQSMDGVIIDLRFNFGGKDSVALRLAGHLTEYRRLGFTKCARNGDTYTQAQQVFVNPQVPLFTNTVVVLASANTISAGENFLMMVRDYQNVLIVGEATASVHSDTLQKTLPNGWTFSISNEIFVAPDGKVYEARGVPPHILVPFYPEEIRRTGKDPQINKAVEIIESKVLFQQIKDRGHGTGNNYQRGYCQENSGVRSSQRSGWQRDSVDK